MAAQNAMEIFTALDKSNCRKCGEKTCLAFAGAVFTGRKAIDQCPLLSEDEKSRLRTSVKDEAREQPPESYNDLLDKLKGLDFHQAAERSGGEVRDGWLVVKVLGKDFKISRDGQFSSDIHINPWITSPLLTYLVYGKGLEPLGKWISFREVKGGRERYGLFNKRTEEGLRNVADAYPDLFADMVAIFQGREVDPQFASDISVVLLPLPKVPIMICYWRPEEGLDSGLNFYFDETVDENLGNDGIYALAAGLATMFEKLAERHGYSPPH